MINLFLFITFTFPKAGIKIEGVPITLQIILFVACLVLCAKETYEVHKKMEKYTILYLYFSYILILTLMLNFANLRTFNILITMVLIGSPLALGIGQKVNYESFIKIICVALIITGIYAIMQWTIGLEATKIPGVNIAYGDSFASKPIGYGYYGFEASKMPSTYQNGNLVGIFYVQAIACMLQWKKMDKSWKYLKWTSIAIGTIGIILSGSRTVMAIYGLMIILLGINVLIKDKQNRKKYIKILGTILILGLITAGLFYIVDSETVNRIIDRYVIQTIADKTASGRTTQVTQLFDYINNVEILEKIRIFFFGVRWSEVKACEGLLNILNLYGVLAFTAIISIFAILIKKVYKINNVIGISLLTIFIAFLVDSSFIYPPILINYFLIAGIYIKRGKEKIDENRN